MDIPSTSDIVAKMMLDLSQITLNMTQTQLQSLFVCMQDSVRSQDAVYAIGGVTSSALGRQMTWDFVRENWTKLHTMYEGGFLLAHLVKLSIDSFADKSLIPQIKVHLLLSITSLMIGYT